jgi:hypothetical protein
MSACIRSGYVVASLNRVKRNAIGGGPPQWMGARWSLVRPEMQVATPIVRAGGRDKSSNHKSLEFVKGRVILLPAIHRGRRHARCCMDSGESGEGFYRAMRLARKSSFQAATLRRRGIESLLVAVRRGLCAMCLIVVKLAGAWSVRTRHSSSRNIMSITQWRLFSMDQWCSRWGRSGPRPSPAT